VKQGQAVVACCIQSHVKDIITNNCWTVSVSGRELCTVINELKEGLSFAVVSHSSFRTTDVIRVKGSDINNGAVCHSIGSDLMSVTIVDIVGD